MKIQPFGSLNATRIQQIEKKYDVALPDRYKKYLQRNNGGIVEPDGTQTIPVQELQKSIELDIFFGVDVAEKAFNLEYWMDEYRGEMPAHSILIGHDTLRGFVLLLCEDGGSRVCYWDDSYNFPQSSEASNAYIMADSFEALANAVQGFNETNDKEGPQDMNRTNYLPLGSIVLIKGGLQKLLIIARALNVRNGGKEYFFDYGAVPYPEGLVGDQMAYFNHDGIAQVIHEGYRCPEDDNMVRIIHEYLDTHPDILRGDARNWNTGA